MRDNTSLARPWQRWSRIGLSTYKAARRAERRGNIEEAKELLKEAAYSFDRAVVKILREISVKKVSRRVRPGNPYPVDDVDKMLIERFKKLCHYENTCKGMLEEKFNERSSELAILRQAELQTRAGEFFNTIDLYERAEMPEKGVGLYLQRGEQTTADNVLHHFYIEDAARYARRVGLEEQARALYGILVEECKKIGSGEGLERAASLILEAVEDTKAAENLYKQAAWAYLSEGKCPISLLKRSGLAEKAYHDLIAAGKPEKAAWLCGLVEDYSRFPPDRIPRKIDDVVIDILTLSETPKVAAMEGKEVLPALQ